MNLKSVGLAIVFLLGHLVASSQTFQSGGNWNTASNWTPASVPSGTGSDVTLNASPTLNSGANNLIGNVTVSNNVQITVNGNAVLTLGSSALFSGGTNKSMTFSNNGTIQVNSGTPDGVLEIWGNLIVNNNLQMQVTGSLIVHGNVTMNNNAQIQVSGGGTVSVGGNVSGGNNAQIQVSGSGSSISIGGGLSLGNGGSLQASGGGTIIAASCSCSGCSTQCSAVLPITLSSFEAHPSEGNVLLSWSTSSEFNFDYFSLQRSANGYDFFELSQIPGHGTTNEPHHYSFEDRFPLLGKSYYRLTSVDFDRYTETFDIVSVVYNGEKSARVYPNPAFGGKINIELSFTPIAPVSVVVTDLNGVEVIRQTVRNPSVSINTTLNPGFYLVKISSQEFNSVVRAMVR